MSQGPVCHIPPKTTAQTPGPKDIPGLPGPISPPTSHAGQMEFNNNLANIINQILALLKMLANQHPTQQQRNNNSRPEKKAQWNETQRVTETVRIFQNNDPTSSNWVDVEQINSLTLTDKNTGANWQWKR